LTLEIITITTPMILNFTVNCYLVESGDGYILIDTGSTSQRATIERQIDSAGCLPGDLKLILLTHGDFDHCGNAAYLKEKFGARIALHRGDLGMVEDGDMFWNRNKPNFFVKMVSGLIFKLSTGNRFTPDIFLEDGGDLTEDGFDAQVVNIPGHSKGSVGFLTPSGVLFCGDLLANVSKPDLWSIIDDLAAARNSVEKLKTLDIATIYPGHGKCFPWEAFWESQI
jgi:glyoxylase-like metal-dependent hydrolase (beta-lactamase superfamily II)